MVVGMVEGDGEGGVVEAGVAGAAATDRAPRGVVLGPQSRPRQVNSRTKKAAETSTTRIQISGSARAPDEGLTL